MSTLSPDPVRELDTADLETVIAFIRHAHALGFMWHAVASLPTDTQPATISYALDYDQEAYE